MLALQAKKAALMRGIHDSAERRAGAGLALDAGEIAALLAPIGPVDELPAARDTKGARRATRARDRSPPRPRVVPRGPP